MHRRTICGWVLSAIVLTTIPAYAQQVAVANALAELTTLRSRVGSADTRTRVGATHRVWSIALQQTDSSVKLMALDLMREPANSGSDHIRMPAVYAIAEIANSSSDQEVKTRALTTLAGPLRAEQVPIRDVAIDAVNSISRNGAGSLATAVVTALAEPIRSGNNGVRIPAINALVRAVEGRGNVAASQAAMDLLEEPLKSSAATGGMEVRMMAVLALERIGADVNDVGAKAKAMGMLRVFSGNGGWEAEARTRAQEGADAVQATIKN